MKDIARQPAKLRPSLKLFIACGLFTAACDSGPKSTSESASASSAPAPMVSAQTIIPSSAAPASANPAQPEGSAAAANTGETQPSPSASASSKAGAKTPLPSDTGGPLVSGSALPASTPKPAKTSAPATSAATPATASATASAAPPPSSAAPSSEPSAPVLAAPAPGSADEIAANVDTIYLARKTFKARFKQEHTQKATGIVKKSSGIVFVEKPNKISFRYDAPNNNRIVSDGTTLKIYVAEDSQMFLQPVQKTEYPGALSFLMGNGLRPSFTFSIHEKAKFEGGPVLNGKPRSATPYYEYVLFYVDKALLEKKEPGVIRRVLIVDAQGNKNRFDFEEVSQPGSIDPSEFIFNPPAGTNIQQGAQ